MSPGPLLEVLGLRAGYKDVQVVHDLDFYVEPGEIVALLGANGAGKTTTLLTVAGMLPSLAGEVRWRGTRYNIPAHRRAREGLSVVTERSVFQQLSVEANLRLGRGDPSRALEMFPELEPLLRRRAGLLSGGEQQILTMARALASEPAALLLDEVSAGLAPLIVTRLFAAAREAADRGAGILLVEQQTHRALSVADRAVVLSRGRRTFSGTGAELAARPEVISASFFAAKSTTQTKASPFGAPEGHVASNGEATVA